MTQQHLVIIFGPPAVGKMTVGTALSRLTGLPLFHNHMTIDLVLPFFGFDQPQFRLVHEFRRRLVEEVAASTLPGIIFTFVWALNERTDRGFIDTISALFRAQGARVAFVELEATLDRRLQRNESEFRLSQKPFKRDLVASRERLLHDEQHYQMNSREDFFYPDEHLKIVNTDLLPERVAELIQERFALPLR